MKTLAVVITTPPYSHLTITALTYVEAALVAGINVIGVFFYQDGVMHANENISIASDEYQAIEHWQRLQKQYQLPLHICITAAEKRGIACDAIDNDKINKAFTVSGLGELVELTTKASRLVQF
ncbi:sulfur reduction protein DsrE [Colwellia sp. MT41]|uniref:Sulfurtransferase TusD n=1 Tax=Colwellia marinimaniae TaxID=1513592 RepID=A0ABQ0MWN0_9GAMM|nr:MULTISPECIES: sulfurtransferase complex subunit TusD [Colwellia]ALO34923.1 sulfur reduction protein DsrE [Colwellia sp. MT41]GAW96784.1 Sulfurtransferase TusD [Colwellia marinimaniae]